MAENVKKAVAEGLKEFYQTQLKPKFDMIEFKLLEHDQRFADIIHKQAEHDERFRDILGILTNSISALPDWKMSIRRLCRACGGLRPYWRASRPDVRCLKDTWRN